MNAAMQKILGCAALGAEPTSGGEYKVICQVHEDDKPSCRIKETDSGFMSNCDVCHQAGVENQGKLNHARIRAKAGITNDECGSVRLSAPFLDNSNKDLSKRNADLDEPVMPIPSKHLGDEYENVPKRRGKRDWSTGNSAMYPVHDEKGDVLYFKVRVQPEGFKKSFSFLHMVRHKEDPNILGWVQSKPDRADVHRLPAILQDPKRTIVFVEGEKDMKFGVRYFADYTFTSMVHFADWKFIDWKSIVDGRRVILWPDADVAGYNQFIRSGFAAALIDAGADLTIQPTLEFELPNKWGIGDLGPGHPRPSGVDEIFVRKKLEDGGQPLSYFQGNIVSHCCRWMALSGLSANTEAFDQAAKVPCAERFASQPGRGHLPTNDNCCLDCKARPLVSTPWEITRLDDVNQMNILHRKQDAAFFDLREPEAGWRTGDIMNKVNASEYGTGKRIPTKFAATFEGLPDDEVLRAPVSISRFGETAITTEKTGLIGLDGRPERRRVAVNCHPTMATQPSLEVDKDVMRVFDEHVEFMSPVQSYRDYLLDTIAFIFQRPLDRLEFFFGWQGVQGGGKTTFIREMFRLIHPTFVDALDNNGMEDNFNQFASAQGAKIIEELFSDKKLYEKMKTLTNEDGRVRRMNKAGATEKFDGSYFIPTNHPAAIIDDGDRRYYYRNDELTQGLTTEKVMAYKSSGGFSRFVSAIKGDAALRANVMRMLLDRDISAYDNHKPMETPDKEHLLRFSKSISIEGHVAAALNEGLDIFDEGWINATVLKIAILDATSYKKATMNQISEVFESLKLAKGGRKNITLPNGKGSTKGNVWHITAQTVVVLQEKYGYSLPKHLMDAIDMTDQTKLELVERMKDMANRGDVVGSDADELVKTISNKRSKVTDFKR